MHTDAEIVDELVELIILFNSPQDKITNKWAAALQFIIKYDLHMIIIIGAFWGCLPMSLMTTKTSWSLCSQKAPGWTVSRPTPERTKYLLPNTKLFNVGTRLFENEQWAAYVGELPMRIGSSYFN